MRGLQARDQLASLLLLSLLLLPYRSLQCDLLLSLSPFILPPTSHPFCPCPLSVMSKKHVSKQSAEEHSPSAAAEQLSHLQVSSSAGGGDSDDSKELAELEMGNSCPSIHKGSWAPVEQREAVLQQFRGKACAICEERKKEGKKPCSAHPIKENDSSTQMLSHASSSGPPFPPTSGPRAVTHPQRAAYLLSHSHMFDLPEPLDLADAQEYCEKYPGSFEGPTLREAKKVRLGDLVELFFHGIKDVCAGEYLSVIAAATALTLHCLLCADLAALIAVLCSRPHLAVSLPVMCSWVEIVKVEEIGGDMPAFRGLITHLVFATSHPNKGDLILFAPWHIANIIKREDVSEIDKKSSK